MEDKVWFENTGVVPEGVTEDTFIEVVYRNGDVCKWYYIFRSPNNDPELWTLDGNSLDVIKWRFV